MTPEDLQALSAAACEAAGIEPLLWRCRACGSRFDEVSARRHVSLRTESRPGTTAVVDCFGSELVPEYRDLAGLTPAHDGQAVEVLLPAILARGWWYCFESVVFADQTTGVIAKVYGYGAVGPSLSIALCRAVVEAGKEQAG